MSTTCPHCGKPLQILIQSPAHVLGRGAAFGSDWQRHTERIFNNAVPAIAATNTIAPEPQFTEAERRTPARAASFESDVLVPATQAAITGIISIIPGALLTGWAGWPWYTSLEIAAGVMTISWLYLLDAHRKLLWIFERVSNTDLDHDGTTGKPEPERIELEIKQPTAHGTNYKLIDLPAGVTTAMLTDFAQRHQIRGLSQTAWAGGGNPFSRTQYDAFMAALQTAGIIRWKNPRERSQGRIVTKAGRAALNYLATN